VWGIQASHVCKEGRKIMSDERDVEPPGGQQDYILPPFQMGRQSQVYFMVVATRNVGL
jgi:hypothetical protein